MKKGILYALIALLSVAIIATLAVIFWDPILDFLPVDQGGWEITENSCRYLDEDGDPVTGWQTVEGTEYYFDPADGQLHTGWLELGDRLYYLNSNGRRVTGWQSIDSSTYYFSDDGVMATGWLEEGATRFYLDGNGHPVSGWQEIEGQLYYFNEDGGLRVGFLETEEGLYFLNSDGTPYTGWLTDSEGTRYFGSDGTAQYGWLEIDGGRYYLDEHGLMQTGWLEIDGKLYYLDPLGTPAAGWYDYEDQRCYLNADGSLYTGWLELDGSTYYLKEDGTLAKGKLVIDGQTHYFTSTGMEILLVNRWNTLAADYEPELVDAQSGVQMTAEAAAALDEMVAACIEAGYNPKVRTAYRNYGWQQQLFNNKMKEGYSYDAAAQIVAIPGTSEHQTGLAVDISDSSYTLLNREQGNTAIQKWFWEHCWEYGFIVRYPDDTTYITGIIYESWHYRYVGLELAMELKELDMCLEEYLDWLTNDGTTCGDPSSLES